MDDKQNDNPIDNDNIVNPEQLPEEPSHEPVPGIERRTLEDVMEDSFFRYSMSVIIDRALARRS